MRAEDGRIVLMDFGTGGEPEDDATSDLAGTPLYSRPRCWRGKSHRSQRSLQSRRPSLSLRHRLVSGAGARSARFAAPMSAASGPPFRPCGPMFHRSSPASSSARSISRPGAPLPALMLFAAGPSGVAAAPEIGMAAHAGWRGRRFHPGCGRGLGTGWPSNGISRDAQRATCGFRWTQPVQRRERQSRRATRHCRAALAGPQRRARQRPLRRRADG